MRTRLTPIFIWPLLGPFGSKCHPSISKVKLVIRNCVIRVWLKLSLGGLSPWPPAKLRFNFLNLFGVKCGKEEKRNSGWRSPLEIFRTFQLPKYFLWRVSVVCVWPWAPSSRIPLFLFSSFPLFVANSNATCVSLLTHVANTRREQATERL